MKQQDQITLLKQTVFVLGQLNNVGIKFDFQVIYFAMMCSTGRQKEWQEVCSAFCEKYLVELDKQGVKVSIAK